MKRKPPTKHPIQPLIVDHAGVVRFKENVLVSYLLDVASTGQKCDMNTLALIPATRDDRQHFAQLIGYSVSGYGDLSYHDRAICQAMDGAAATLTKKRRRKP